MSGDLLDFILIVLVIAFAVSGYRQGFIIGAFSFLGFVGGGFLGVLIAPPIAHAVVDAPTDQALLAIVIVFLAAVVGQFACSTIGAVVRSHITWEPARTVDALGGTFTSALSVLVIAWLIGSLLSVAPFPWLRQQTNGSLLLQTVDAAMPERAKAWRLSFKEFVDTSEFPQVFNAIGNGGIIEVPPPDASVVKGPGMQRARRAIVKVQGTAPACRKRIEGTGFVYAPNHVMTNAHVVAGVTQDLRVTDAERDGHDAQVVLYNPDRDIAILYVPDLNVTPLKFDYTPEEQGSAIIAGFPKGKGFTTSAARLRGTQNAKASDIYSRKTVTREVYAIRGLVQPGNSGGPLLTPTGQVYGVIFAAATDQPDTGYALTAKEVRPDADTGSGATTHVDTQDCD
ncbi:acid resistance periplasmic serine protease MarP [Sphaerisporangium siamense]|uniref:S1-C subfamily serine protease n=1 Tax=Sphaerisporangium siamense TaxID=795645 RepID=A0A7W7D2J3_9ACTN|nr:MarP family serine protease [Sphaerisporangium siamense]MBB4699073.1 S1-C subfamily serine protease [Sphaerisporangium siamense]GII86800.1 acid resistance periplasmic serine protease MarP [Sphaerisporangium siamense]